MACVREPLYAILWSRVECMVRPLQSEVLTRLTEQRVCASVRPYVTEGAYLLWKWRHFPQIDHDVLCGKSLTNRKRLLWVLTRAAAE